MENTVLQKAAAQKALQQASPKKTLQSYIKSMEGEIAKALPSVITPERFTRITLSAISVNPKLAECTPASFLGAMMTSAQLGLEPNTPLGQAYLLPYKNGKSGNLECQFQVGYKGLLDMAYRSGEIRMVQAHKVYEGDEFEYNFGLHPDLIHKPCKNHEGQNVIAYYAVYETVSGGFGFEVMTIDDIKQHARKYSKAYDYGPWKTNFDEMALKTVLKKLLKYAPMKSDFVRGVAQDETIKSDLSVDMFEVPDQTEYVVVDEATGEVTNA